MKNIIKIKFTPLQTAMFFATILICTLSGCGGGGNENPSNEGSVEKSSVDETEGNSNASKTTISVLSTNSKFGTFATPFAVDSLWNSKPVNPILGTYVLPITPYFPFIGVGDYSTGVFKANTSDSAITVTGIDGTPSTLWDADAHTYRNVTVPHWPTSTLPSIGTDGHADIIDEAAGVIHSFWQLKQVNGQWRATQYAWMPLAGSGWGTPSHQIQGARSAGVSSAAGLIRIAEVNDGSTHYRHALAMTLAHNALSAKPSYVFPATSADWDAATANHGSIPLGTLMMLPSTFNSASIANPQLRKVVETLKIYGARIVDRNTDTRFTLMAENGSALNLMPNGWNSTVASDLQKIADLLRPVASTAGWIDGKGTPFVPKDNFNLLSLRGPWIPQNGNATANFNTLTQSLELPIGTPGIQVHNWGNSFSTVDWALLTPGKSYRLSVKASNGSSLKLTFTSKINSAILFESKTLANEEFVEFIAPADVNAPVISVFYNGIANTVVSADLVRMCAGSISCPAQNR